MNMKVCAVFLVCVVALSSWGTTAGMTNTHYTLEHTVHLLHSTFFSHTQTLGRTFYDKQIILCFSDLCVTQHDLMSVSSCCISACFTGTFINQWSCRYCTSQTEPLFVCFVFNLGSADFCWRWSYSVCTHSLEIIRHLKNACKKSFSAKKIVKLTISQSYRLSTLDVKPGV